MHVHQANKLYKIAALVAVSELVPGIVGAASTEWQAWRGSRILREWSLLLHCENEYIR